MASYKEHLVGLAACELYECSTFKQMLEFPDVELIYRLQVKQFGWQGSSCYKDGLRAGGGNSSI
jgi:hypothetical protein